MGAAVAQRSAQTNQCRGDREVEAESVAYLVAADHGLDTAEYTFAYVAGWAATTGDVDTAVRASATRVLATAHTVLDGTHDHLAAAADVQYVAELVGDVAQVEVAAVDPEQLAVRAFAGADRTAA